MEVQKRKNLLVGSLLHESLSLLNSILDGANHVEGLLGEIIVLSLKESCNTKRRKKNSTESGE